MVEKIWGAVAPSDMLVLLIILSLLLAVVLLLTGFIGRRLLSFSIEDEIVLQFCGSKKSLASGLPIASVLFPGPQLGLILLPLMLFHQIQLIRSEEHTSELQSLMRISYAVFCLKKKKQKRQQH